MAHCYWEMEEGSRKRLRVGHEVDEGDAKLAEFLKWIKTENISVSDKVYISKRKSCAGYGLIAAEDIDPGVCLFEIPRTAVLWQCNSRVKVIVANELEKLRGESGWVPLLVTLICEYSDPLSRWRPYLDLMLERATELDLPMYWDSASLNELERTELKSSVENDLEKMKEELETYVLPFFKRNEQLITFDTVTFDLYKKMTAFVMANSFTEPLTLPIGDRSSSEEDDDDERTMPPMMVPLADILNHVAKNNAELEFGKVSLKMVSVCDIRKGEEIFNTYGTLSNEDLLHMYGFAELYPRNHNDSVEFPRNALLHVYEKQENANKDKVGFIKSSKFISEVHSPFAIGLNAILGEDQVERALKTLHADENTIKRIEDNQGWLSDDEEEDEDQSFSFEKLSNLPVPWKNLLIRAAEQQLALFSTDLNADEELINCPEKLINMPKRSKWALYVRYGQKMILNKFLNSLKA